MRSVRLPRALALAALLLSTALGAQTAASSPLTLSVNPADLSVQVTDARNRYVWSSAPPEADLADLNDAWIAFARSGVSIDWYQKGGVVTRRTSATANGSKITVAPMPGGYRGTVRFAVSGIEVDVELSLKDDGLLVRVPADGVREPADAKLARVWLYPFLGAVKGADPNGYLVLPDGPGTLVPFRDAAPPGSEAWVKPVWGVDMADGTDPSWNNWDRIQWPVYGLVRKEGQAAWVAEVASGGELASLQAWPAGVTTGFTWLTASFQVRKPYVQPTARSGAGITVVPALRQVTDLAVQFRFTAGANANWLGLATRVQQAWRPTLPSVAKPASWNLTILGSASTGQLLGRGEILMTSAEQARAIVAEATTFARAPGQIVLHGWQQGGEGWGTPVTSHAGLGFSGEKGLVGLVSDLRRDRAVALTGHLMLATDGNPDWSIWTDQALRYNTTAMRWTFDSGPALTLLNPRAIQEKADQFGRFAKALGAGMMLWDEAQLLSGWGGEGGGGRVKALEARRATLKSLGEPLVLLDPASWALPSTRAIIGFPLWSSGLRWGGASVPFLPRLLHGVVQLYGGDLNYSPDVRHDLLRLVDFGLGPSVTVTAEPAYKLEMSALTMFSSTWSDWGPTLREDLAWIAPALDLAQTRTLVSRVEAPGPVVTETFDNGAVLVLDYPKTAWSLTKGGQP